jgi:tetratricopeptide (TPR) repeat protein
MQQARSLLGELQDLTADQGTAADTPALDALSSVADGWERDVRLLAGLDGSLYQFRHGSDRAHYGRLFRSNLDALSRYGVDLHGDGSASWLAAARDTILSSRLRSHLLASVQSVRNLARGNDDEAAFERATELLGVCHTGVRQTIHTGKWGGRRPEQVALMRQLLPEITDPVELIFYADDLDRLGMGKELDARIATLALERPSNHFVLFCWLRREWSRYSWNEHAPSTGNDDPRKELEPLIAAVLASNPEYRAGWVYRARLHAWLDDPRAEEACRLALDQFPDEPAVLLFMGLHQSRRGDVTAARATLERLLAVSPDENDGYLLLAELAKSPDERLDLLQRGVDSDPVYWDTVQALARERIQRREWQLAIDTLAPFLGCARQWRTTDAYPLLTECARGQGDDRRAELCARVLENLQAQPAPKEPGESNVASAKQTGTWRDAVARLRDAVRGPVVEVHRLVDHAEEMVGLARAHGDEDLWNEAWAVVDVALERLEREAAGEPRRCLDVFLEVQVLQNRSQLRRALEAVSVADNRGESSTGRNARVQETFERLKSLRDKVRPKVD